MHQRLLKKTADSQLAPRNVWVVREIVMGPIRLKHWMHGTVTWNRYLCANLVMAATLIYIWALAYWLTIHPLPRLPADEEAYTRFLFWITEQMPWLGLVGTFFQLLDYAWMRGVHAQKKAELGMGQ